VVSGWLVLEVDALSDKASRLDRLVVLVHELRQPDIVLRRPHLLRVVGRLLAPRAPPAVRVGAHDDGRVGAVGARVISEVWGEAEKRLRVEEELHLGEGSGVVVLGVGPGGNEMAVRDVAPVSDIPIVREALSHARPNDGVDRIREQVRDLRHVGGVGIAGEEDNLLDVCFAERFDEAALGAGHIGERCVRVVDLKIGASVEHQAQVGGLLELVYEPRELRTGRRAPSTARVGS